MLPLEGLRSIFMSTLREGNGRDLSKLMAWENQILANPTQRMMLQLQRQIKRRHKATLQITCPDMSLFSCPKILSKREDVRGNRLPVRNLCISLYELPLRTTRAICSPSESFWVSHSYLNMLLSNAIIYWPRPTFASCLLNLHNLWGIYPYLSQFPLQKLHHLPLLPSFIPSTPYLPRIKAHKVLSGILPRWQI